MNYVSPSRLHFRIAQVASRLVSSLLFRRRLLRNDLKGVKGPYVVIANHGAALDFVNLIDATSTPMHFVISNSFYTTLPIRGFLDKLGVIPKQQFQTTADDLKRMKEVIRHGEPLVIYPAGLMCEDGLSTPIPTATYKFLKWLDADVYVARAQGSYFVMPKWSKRIRPGKTTMNIYRLFTREELAELELSEIKEKTDEALLFDSYREQEQLRIPYYRNDDLAGLEAVLYRCPYCGKEFTMTVQGNTLRCAHCGTAHTADKFGFLHKTEGPGQEIRYISDRSRWIYQKMESETHAGCHSPLTAETAIHMIDPGENKFREVGTGTVTLDGSKFLLEGALRGAPLTLTLSVAGVPTLPFSPGKYFELQHGKTIYRCVLRDGRPVMKFINAVKLQFQQNHSKKSLAS